MGSAVLGSCLHEVTWRSTSTFREGPTPCGPGTRCRNEQRCGYRCQQDAPPSWYGAAWSTGVSATSTTHVLLVLLVHRPCAPVLLVLLSSSPPLFLCSTTLVLLAPLAARVVIWAAGEGLNRWFHTLALVKREGVRRGAEPVERRSLLQLGVSSEQVSIGRRPVPPRRKKSRP
jgi:hypothetical protein